MPTLGPEETVSGLVDFFRKGVAELGPVEALAVGTFGPADLAVGSATYGSILGTPKRGWAGVRLLEPLRLALGGVPVVFETDVNAALLGEVAWGAARALKNVVYLTVGTGIGGALMVDGKLVYGLGHPEMGHLRVKRHERDEYAGHCSFHGDCLEGLASGPALEARWEVAPEDLEVGHIAWEIEADYLAQACLNVLMIAPPERVILGGGVMRKEGLLFLVRERLREYLRGYLAYDELAGDLSDFVVPPSLGGDAGLLGCVEMGQGLLRKLGAE